MKKSERIPDLVSRLGPVSDTAMNPYYAGYFKCFNAGDYYEAHDVLEHLWLGCRDENRSFYQGLIQIAGAFVHLRKQYLRPDHPKDGARTRPALRLFLLGVKNIAPFGPRHLRLDVTGLCELCKKFADEIENSGRNPWQPADAPKLRLSEVA